MSDQRINWFAILATVLDRHQKIFEIGIWLSILGLTQRGCRRNAERSAWLAPTRKRQEPTGQWITFSGRDIEVCRAFTPQH